MVRLPFLARRIRPRRWASCRRDPPWDETWIRTFASGKSNELSATCVQGNQQTSLNI